MRNAVAFVLLALFSLACGCLKPALSDLPNGSIFWKAFRNRTFFREFDECFNFDLQKTLSRRGSLIPVGSERDADYVLCGDIVSIRKRIIRSGRNDATLESEYKCVISFELLSGKGDKRNRKGRFSRTWRNVIPLGENEHSSLALLSQFLAEELVRELQNNW